jgi:acetolactate synthase small subunit
MRILNAASRRGLELDYVHAEAGEHDHQATLVLDVNPKQVGQLSREWYAIADVIHVGTAPAQAAEWARPHPAAGVTMDGSRPAARA